MLYPKTYNDFVSKNTPFSEMDTEARLA